MPRRHSSAGMKDRLARHGGRDNVRAGQQGRVMSTIVIVHGAWGGSWAWRKFSRLLRDNGHEVFTPTLTGLGDRSHLLTREVGLDHHISDVAAVLEFEDLTDVVLVGHS